MGLTHPTTMASRTLIDLFDERVSSRGDHVALRYWSGVSWAEVSYADWYRSSMLLAAGLVDAGLGPGERVALVSRTRVEWVIADIAIAMAGGVSVPVYPSSRARQCALILEDAGVTTAIVEDAEQLQKLLDARDAMPALERVVVIDDESGDVEKTRQLMNDARRAFSGGCIHVGALRESGALALGRDANIVQRRRHALRSESLASLVYTAGTTGRPRGVALSHRAFVEQLESNGLVVALKESDVQLLMLPLAQIFARTAYLSVMAAGAITAFSRGFRSIAADFAAVRPTAFVGVPRVFESMVRGWTDQFAEGPVGQRLIDGIRSLAREKATQSKRWSGLHQLRYSVANVAAYRGVRQLFGGRLRFAITGGAPMRVELSEFLVGAGVPLLEGYGLTETCGAVTVQQPGGPLRYTVGSPLPGVDVELADDGEILVRGPTIMDGYWGQPDATADVLRDGWLHTGDVGEWEGEELRITDRKKDLIITAGGRNVAPAPIERALQDIPFVEHAIVHGDQRDYLAALVTLDIGETTRWAEDHRRPSMRPEDLRTDPLVYAALDDAIKALNLELAPGDAIRAFAILPDGLKLEAGELTETGKKRRLFVARKYRSLLDSLFDE